MNKPEDYEKPRGLAIFDYHGTLIWALDAHDVAFQRTVKEVYGVDGSIHDVYFAASTIQDVTKAIAEAKGGGWLGNIGGERGSNIGNS